MKCPICSARLYEDERREVTAGTFISVRCSKPGCGYSEYRMLPVSIHNGDIKNKFAQNMKVEYGRRIYE